MKNIHVLRTDKPSRLHFDGELFLSPNYQVRKRIDYNVEGRNIYITSDEEIKIGNLVLNIEENTIFKPSTYEIYHIKNSEAKYYEYCKKIILTTDRDLIKDGVQAIDDEFLEWFVKNPSCEEVEVKELLSNNGNAFYGYKISIPQEEPNFFQITLNAFEKSWDLNLEYIEEPKQECYICPQTKLQCDDECCVSAEDCHIEAGFGIVSDCEPPKEETLEEAAKSNYDNKTSRLPAPTSHWVNSEFLQIQNFIEGAKWQQEQDKKMYSEEEVKLLIDFVKDCANNWDCDNDSHKYNTPCRMCDAQKVLEQFKKK
jgi:hypothetical protein